MQIQKLLDTSLEFSLTIIGLVQELKSGHESVISPQIAKSGTMAGAYIHEAQFAPNKTEYVAKLQQALNQTNQTAYWIDLLYRIGYIHDHNYRDLSDECDSMRGLIILAIEEA